MKTVHYLHPRIHPQLASANAGRSLTMDAALSLIKDLKSLHGISATIEVEGEEA